MAQYEKTSKIRLRYFPKLELKLTWQHKQLDECGQLG